MMDTEGEFFRGTRIVITGASGFIGSRLIELLRDVDCDIVRVLRTPAPCPRNGRAKIVDVVGDVRGATLWMNLVAGADVIFHLAAQTSVAVADGDAEGDFEQNVAPMRHLLDACAHTRPAIVFASTSTVVGMPHELPVTDLATDAPLTVYDAHKKEAEDLLLGYARGVSLRLTNVYGPGPLSRRPDRGVLNAMIARALHGQDLLVYGEGASIRDYVYIDDVARAFLAGARQIERVEGGHFLVGTGVGTAVGDAIRLVAARAALKTSLPVTVRNVPAPAGAPVVDGRNFIADSSRFTEAAGWKAGVSLVVGIDRTIEAMPAMGAAES